MQVRGQTNTGFEPIPDDGATIVLPEPQYSALFDQLSHSILKDATVRSTALADRLWRLGRVVAYYLDPEPGSNNLLMVQQARKLQRRAAIFIRQQNLDGELLQAIETQAAHFDSQGLELRTWRTQDSAIYTELLDDAVLWRYLPERYPDPVTQELAESLIEVANNLPDHHRVWAISENGVPIGQIRAEWHDFSRLGRAAQGLNSVAEISYWIGRANWGKGLASKAIVAGSTKLFQDYRDLEEINARVMPENKASCRALIKAGYRSCGIFGGRNTEIVFRLFRESYAPLLD